MTMLVVRAAGRAAARGRATGRPAAHVDPLTVEAIRLITTIVLVVVAFAGLAGLATTLGPIGIPAEGPTPGGP